MKYLILIILFCIQGTSLVCNQAQQNKIDSLLNALTQVDSTNKKILIYKELCYEYEPISPKEGIEYGLRGLELSKKINSKKLLADFNLFIGRNYFALKEYDIALEYYSVAKSVFHKLNDKETYSYTLSHIANLYSHKSNYAKLLDYLNQILLVSKELNKKEQVAYELNNIGLVNLFLSNYDEALESFNEAYLINSELKDTISLGFNSTNTARVYKELGEYDKALEKFIESLNLFTISDDVYNISKTYYYISDIYFQESNYNQSLFYVNKAINDLPVDSISKKYQVRVYAESLVLKSEILLELGKFSKALSFAKQGLEFSTKIKYKEGVATSHSSLGRIKFIESYNNKSIIFSAIDHFIKAEEVYSKVGELKKRAQNLKHLSSAYELNGDAAKALTAYRSFVSLKDSIFNEENMKQIGRIESDFEYKIQLAESKKDKEIAIEKEKKVKTQNSILYVIISSLLIIFSLFLFFYIRRKNNIKVLNEKNSLIETQKKEIGKKNEQLIKMNMAKDKIFGTISHDLQNTVKGFIAGTKDENTNIDYIKQSALKMKELLNSLLTYADKNFNQYVLEICKVDLTEIINKTLDLYSKDIKSKNLEFSKTYEKQFAQTNYDYAEIIIRNVVHNSIKFSMSKGLIEISLTNEDNYTILKIKDYGIGIPESDIEKINNYQRPEIQTPIGNISKGTGFGLVTAKEFIEKLDGHLFVESEINEHTTILLYFPSGSK